MKNKILTLLGFAAKAGKLSFGFMAATAAVTAKKSYLVLAAYDTSEKTRKEVMFVSGKSGVSVITLRDIDMHTLSHATGHKCGIISVNDKSFAESLKEEILNDQQI